MKDVVITVENPVSLPVLLFRIFFISFFDVVIPIASIVFAFIHGFETITQGLLFFGILYLYTSLVFSITYMMLLKNNNY